MIADLDTLLTALYVELTDRIIPALGFARRGPGQRPEVTDAELACIAVAQVLLRFDDERHWLRIASRLVGHLFPRLLRQSEYNGRLKNLAPLMEAALRWLADATPGSAEDDAADGRHPRPMRALGHHRETFWPGRLGGLRLLPQPFPLVPGRQAADHLHPRRHRYLVQVLSQSTRRWPRGSRCDWPKIGKYKGPPVQAHPRSRWVRRVWWFRSWRPRQVRAYACPA